MAEDGVVLASLNADRLVHPASVVKVASTLALLGRLGPDHRFETRLLATGPVRDGTIQGDLVVEAEGDPALVFENAFFMLLELRAQGVRGVDGGLEVRGPLLFNWRSDREGTRLRLALAGRAGAEAWAALRAVRGDAGIGSLNEAALVFGGRGHRPVTAPRLILVHRSPPLRRILKELNCYSNNVFHVLSEQIGGPAAVERLSRESVPAEMRPAIVIDNAAGSGQANRLSPRAAVALVLALDREVGRHGLSLADVLPVAGIDAGTVEERFGGPTYRGTVLGKTGTFGSLGVSALAGVARTRRYGKVSFAILNNGLSVAEARGRQDSFVEALLEAGGAVQWPYRPAEGPPLTEVEVERGG